MINMGTLICLCIKEKWGKEMKLKKCYKYMLVMAMTMIMALGLIA